MENKINQKLFFIAILIILAACNSKDTEKKTVNNDTNLVNVANSIQVNSPENGKVFSLGDKIKVIFNNLSLQNKDSISISINQKPFYRFDIDGGNIILNTDSLSLGRNSIQIELKTLHESKFAQLQVVLKAAHPPLEYTYKVIKSFPHDDKSYTQGLEFYNGIMYEGSGQYGESMLRRYKLETGQLLQSYNLPNNVFGEGIVIYKNKIYQLTWQSHIAYEYDLESFKLIRTFEFNTEGWGITKYNDLLVMSDGSNTLYFLNPETFTEVKRIEVYNHIGPVTYLNELENIGGKIYANVYQTDDIVIINPENGVVEGKINFKNLLNKNKVKRQVDVLNGIAYDFATKRMFVTGKYWPEIYQVEIMAKK
ncbi:MAG: glutaminyl-peptide cyclotransferase [Bacteroidales bacterium]|nr:glutaminyl-peptide cyclotransferase [Bacteroidales bacterium]